MVLREQAQASGRRAAGGSLSVSSLAQQVVAVCDGQPIPNPCRRPGDGFEQRRQFRVDRHRSAEDLIDGLRRDAYGRRQVARVHADFFKAFPQRFAGMQDDLRVVTPLALVGRLE